MFKFCIKYMPSYKEQKFWSKGSVKLSILMFTVHIPERLSYINNMQKYPHKNDGFSSFFVFFVLCIILQPIRFKYKSVEILLSITEVYKYLIDTGLNFFYLFLFIFVFKKEYISYPICTILNWVKAVYAL